MNELLVGDLLEATSSITDIVGDRIRPGVLDPGDDLPNILYDLQSLDVDDAAGDGNTESGSMGVDVTCLASTYLEARTLRNLIIDTISGWNDDTTNPKIQPSHVTSCVYDSDGANPGNDVVRHAFVINAYVPYGDFTLGE